MKWYIPILLAVLIVAAAWSPRSVQAAPPRLPATVYPPGAHVGYQSNLSNRNMDCMWGFVCEGSGLPNFHFTTQDRLHRVSGWAQFAGIQHGGRTTMAFELFVSRYDPVPDETGIPWSKQGFADLKLALRAQGYHLDQRAIDRLPTTRNGDTFAAIQHLGTQDLVAMATWSGTREIEGIALYDHRSQPARSMAWTSLTRQIRLALSPGL